MQSSLHQSIEPGLYRHYKGNNYHVYGLAIHSETHEALVVYRALYGDFLLSARPLDMFLENVTVNGEEISRFTLIESKASPIGSSPLGQP